MIVVWGSRLILVPRFHESLGTRLAHCDVKGRHLTTLMKTPIVYTRYSWCLPINVFILLAADCWHIARMWKLCTIPPVYAASHTAITLCKLSQ